MNSPNGSNHGAPLHLNAQQRAAILKKAGISSGWVLLSVSEMFELKKQMEGCANENERLNKQTAKIVARQIVNAAITDKTLKSVRAFLEIVAAKEDECGLRVHALNEIASIDEAISVLPAPLPQQTTEEGKPNA